MYSRLNNISYLIIINFKHCVIYELKKEMSDSEDENYATFGIPLEPLDEGIINDFNFLYIGCISLEF